jgi:aminoglycoside phosphotransferase family enzyme
LDKTTDLNGDIGLEAKVAFLRQSDAYPEAPQAVEVRETHMSWVFLTDTYAYKLKKPVCYAFLDFSTVEARRLNCEREVRLNRRLAPNVYLGTVALKVGVDGKLHLDEDGRIVDWLVKMRRLPAERTLEHAIAAGVVQEADVRRVVARLAAFYRNAAVVAVNSEEYRRRFEVELHVNRQELSRPAFGLSLDVVDGLAAAQAGFLAAHGHLLEVRARSRRIVECHGDLRPEHIYLGDDPVVVDCLEFNREFRILDPADELAYLAMECDRLGAPYVEAWVFETYRHETGDHPPGALLDFYKCWRAYLRAKIAIWHLDEPRVREPSKWVQRTDQYLRLARGYSLRFA